MDVLVFTDGSFIGKTRTAGYGIYFPNGELENIGRPFKLKPFTNQRAELFAIYVAIVTIIKHIDIFNQIIIYTDSKYSIDTLTKWMYSWSENNWLVKRGKKIVEIKNLDIIRDKLFPLVCKLKDKIILRHVRSHTKKTDVLSVCNSIADAFAIYGALKNTQEEIILDLKQIEKELLEKQRIKK